MKAIIVTGGKQYTVSEGDVLFVEKLGAEAEAVVKFDQVLAILDGVVLRIGLSWLFGIYFGWGFYGFVLGYGLAPYGYAIPSMIYFLSGIWKKRKVLADDL